jgi:deoxycytidine triphosphate deaminase
MAVTFIRNRITHDAEGYERHNQSDASLLFTKVGDVSEFELALTIGDVYASRHPTEDGSFTALPDEKIVLPAYSCVTVETAEEMSVPLNLFGIIFPKGGLAHVHGVFSPTTKIDPGFSGRLRLLLFNGSARRIVLHKGQSIGAAVFLKTDATVPHPLVEKREKLTPAVQNWGDRFSLFAKRHKTTWATIVIPILSALIAAASLWYGAISADAAKRSAIAAEAVSK